MNEYQLANAALDQLQANTGLKGTYQHIDDAIDGHINFEFENGNQFFYAEVKKELRQHQIPKILNQAKTHQPFIVIAENIFPALKERLRNEKIGYLDLAGNIYINTPNQYIWIEGNKAIQVKDKERNRAFTKTGLKIILYLLENKEALNFTYRKLAEEIGVALGNINYVIEGLKEAGFILALNNKNMMFQNKKALLDRWITGYGETLKPANFIGAYKFWKTENIRDWNLLPVHAGKTNWGGEPAAEFLTQYLNPAQLTVYTTEKQTLMKEWTLLPQNTTENAHVLMYNKFWKRDEIGNQNLAPIPLIYADLILTDDPRCLEAAAMIYEKFLKDEFE
jgi:hypothetical protein